MPDESRDDLARWLEGDGLPAAAAPPRPAPAEPFPADADGEYGRPLRADAARPPARPRAAGAIATGSPGLDRAIGAGGWPRGHIAELYGAEGSGKSTLALQAIAEAQAEGGVAALVDAEHGLDPAHARRLGVDLGTLLIHQPDDGDQATLIGEMLLSSGSVDLLVVDSVAALAPREEIDGFLGEMPAGLQAAMMGRTLRRWSAALRRSGAAVVLVNQLRRDPRGGWRDPSITAGGRSLRFYASLRVELAVLGRLPCPGADPRPGDPAGWGGGEPAQGGTGQDGPGDGVPPAGAGRVAGLRVRAAVTKNRLAPPGGMAVFDLLFGRGVDRLAERLDAARADGRLRTDAAGRWRWRGHDLGAGRAEVRAWFAARPEAEAELERQGEQVDGARLPERSVT